MTPGRWTMRCCTTLAVLAGGLAWADEVPLARSELALSSGVVVTGTTYNGGGNAAPFAALSVSGRLLVDVVALELEGLGQVPVIADGPLGSMTGLARVGVVFPRWLVTAGAMVNATGGGGALQVLPSVTAAVRAGPVVASLGLFDRCGLAPAHLSVSWHEVGIGWVFPLGGEAFGRFPLTPHLQLEARFIGLSIFNAFTFSGLVGLVWRPS